MRKLDDETLRMVAQRIGRRECLTAVYCFGSQVDPDSNRCRDADFGVLAEEKLPLDEVLDIRAEVASLLRSEDVDVVDMHRAGPVLQRQIIATGRTLYCEDETVLAEYELRVLARYRDSRYWRKKQYELMIQGLEEK